MQPGAPVADNVGQIQLSAQGLSDSIRQAVMVNIDGEEVMVHLAMLMGLYPSKLSRVGESFEDMQIRYGVL